MPRARPARASRCRRPRCFRRARPPTTAAKFAAWRRIAALREGLLIDPKTRSVELYRVGADGLWVLHPAEPNTNVQLTPAALWAEMPQADDIV